MKKNRILIVDDIANISHLLAILLRRCGDYEVLEENRSLRAVRTAEEFRPDLILLDVDMPGKSGGEVAAELSVHPHLAAVPVVFVTSLVSEGEAGQRCVKRGEHYFLPKPISSQLLLQTVREMLRRGAPIPAVA